MLNLEMFDKLGIEFISLGKTKDRLYKVITEQLGFYRLRIQNPVVFRVRYSKFLRRHFLMTLRKDIYIQHTRKLYIWNENDECPMITNLYDGKRFENVYVIIGCNKPVILKNLIEFGEYPDNGESDLILFRKLNGTKDKTCIV